MKAHIAVDAAIVLTEKVVTTAANEHDLNAADRLITVPVEVVFDDAGYRGAEKRESLLGLVKYWFIARGPHAVKKFRKVRFNRNLTLLNKLKFYMSLNSYN